MILGLTGTFGAGKGAIVDYLTSQKDFAHYSASGYLKEVIKQRGLMVNRDSMIAVANELRAEQGPSHIVETLCARAQKIGGNAIIESLRAVAEVERVKELGGLVVGVDAEPRLRYERSLLRGSEKDDVSFEKWSSQEAFESNSTDPTRQNIPGAVALADYVIDNNGTLEDLHQEIEAIIQKYID